MAKNHQIFLVISREILAVSPNFWRYIQFLVTFPFYCDATKIFGDVTKIFGSVTEILVGVTKIFGDDTKIFGDNPKKFGDVTKAFGGVTERWGYHQIVKRPHQKNWGPQ